MTLRKERLKPGHLRIPVSQKRLLIDQSPYGASSTQKQPEHWVLILGPSEQIAEDEAMRVGLAHVGQASRRRADGALRGDLTLLDSVCWLARIAGSRQGGLVEASRGSGRGLGGGVILKRRD